MNILACIFGLLVSIILIWCPYVRKYKEMTTVSIRITVLYVVC